MLFAGGAFGVIYDTTDIYDVGIDSWSTSHLAVPVYLAAGSGVGSLILIGGGSEGSTESSIVNIYDIHQKIWRTVNLSIARYAPASGVASPIVLFVGGLSYNSTQLYITLTAVDIYNATSDSWTSSSLSQGSIGALVGAGTMTKILFGGDGSNVVDIFDVNRGTFTSSTLGTSNGRSSMSAAGVADIIMFAGGASNTAIYSEVDIYNVTTGQWTSLSLSRLVYLSATAATNNVIIVAGGQGSFQPNPTGQIDEFIITTPTNPTSPPSPTTHNVGPTPSLSPSTVQTSGIYPENGFLVLLLIGLIILQC